MKRNCYGFPLLCILNCDMKLIIRVKIFNELTTGEILLQCTHKGHLYFTSLVIGARGIIDECDSI